MKKSLCLLIGLTVAASAMLSGCGTDGSDAQATTIAATEKTEAASPNKDFMSWLSSSDEARQDYEYDFVAVKQKSEEITDNLNRITTESGFSGSVYMKLGNDFEYINSKGYADISDRVKNSITGCFYTGGFTRQLTAAAVLKLAEEGKLDLDDKLEKYFPVYDHGDEITVRDLLSMKSGIKDYAKMENSYNDDISINEELRSKISSDNTAGENRQIVYEWIVSQELVSKPGTLFSESDSDYFLLGEIIADVSKMSYEDYISEAILKPLGMKSSGFAPNDSLATAYEGELDDSGMRFPGVGYSSFGLISSVSDITKWIDGLLGEKIISKKSLDLMLGRDGKTNGYGVYVGSRYVSSVGSVDNYSSKVAFTADKSEIFIALTNYAHSSPALLHSQYRNYLLKYKI